MILSELLPFLKALGVRPKKGLSQNFLIDPNIVRKIVEMAEVSAEDCVLEIGSGPGALTSALLAKGARVFAVEADSLFAKELSRLQTIDERLCVFEADFLEFDLQKLPSPIKVVANLPYHITTPILEKLFESSKVSSLTIMVQKEVADRMRACHGSKTFGCLSIFVQFYSKIKGAFTVSPNSFYPRPKVDSSVIRLDRVKPPLEDAAPFFSLVRCAFQKRRKMLTTSLQEKIPLPLLQRLLGEKGRFRPEDLSLEEWLDFFGKKEEEELGH